MDPLETYVECKLCFKKFANDNWLINHVKNEHVEKSNFNCRFCDKVYNSSGSLRSHVSRMHKRISTNISKFFKPSNIPGPSNEGNNVNVEINSICNTEPNNLDLNTDSDSDEDPDSDHNINFEDNRDTDSDPGTNADHHRDVDSNPDDDFDPDQDPDSKPDSDDSDIENDSPFKKILAEYLLYLRAQTRATNKDILNILKNLQIVVQFFVKHYLNLLSDKIHSILRINVHDFINIQELIDSIDCVQGLSSIYKQDVYFEKIFGIIKPLRIELGSKFINYGPPTIDENQKVKRKSEEMIFLPISTVLSKWLENGHFRDMINIPRNEEGIYSTYVDGNYFQNHTFRIAFPNSILIRLYYDEAEMCNAVGSKADYEINYDFSTGW